MRYSLLEEFFEQRMYTEGEQRVIQDERYQVGEEVCIQELNNMTSLLTTPEQKIALDTLIGVYNISAGNYGLITYEQGFKDGIRLLMELNALLLEQN